MSSEFVQHLKSLGLDPEGVFTAQSISQLPRWDAREFTFVQSRLLDAQGYVICKELFSADVVQEMCELTDNYLEVRGQSSDFHAHKFSFLELSPLFFLVMEHPWFLQAAACVLGPQFRFDHAFGFRVESGHPMHGLHGGPVASQGHNVYTGGLPLDQNLARTNRVNIGIALTPQNKDVGGFCCVPGSHKLSDCAQRNAGGDSNLCEHWDELVRQDALVVPTMEPGDCVVFVDSLVHGTYPHTDYRSTLYYMYSSGFSTFRPPEQNTHYLDFCFTDRQRKLLCSPYVAASNPLTFSLQWREPSV